MLTIVAARKNAHVVGVIYASALCEYLEGHGGKGITEALDEVYGSEEAAGGLDPALARLQEASLPRDEEW